MAGADAREDAAARAVDAVSALLRAGVSPDDARVQALMGMARVAASARVRADPPVTGNPPRFDPAARVLPFEAAQRAVRGALREDSVFEGSDARSALEGDRSRRPPSVFRTARGAAAEYGAGQLDASPEVVFRLRAQIAAFRMLSRAADPSPEVLIASCGTRRPRTADVLHPADSSLRLPYDELLMKRKELVDKRIQIRRDELAPLSKCVLPEDIRRSVALQENGLRLVEMQRELRQSVREVMHDTLDLPSPLSLGGGVQKLKKPEVRLVSDVADHVSAGGHVPLATDMLTHDAKSRVRAMERREVEELEELKLRRRAKYSAELMVHATAVRSYGHVRGQKLKRLHKDLERHFRDRVREEDRRKRKEQQDRLRALRNNDEDEYLALLENTKNTRLLQLLRQTDEYLSQLGAQVEAQREAMLAQDVAEGLVANGGETGLVNGARDVVDIGEEEGGGNGGGVSDSVKAMRARRNQYYKITHTVKEEVVQPTTLVGGKLKPYQIDGLEWMVSLYNNGLNGILADEMGLGKTIQTISLVTYLVEFKKNKGPFLIIVPLSTISNWVRELEAWAPSLRKIVYKGNPDRRKKLQQTEMTGVEYNVVLTTYEFVVKDKQYLGRIAWKYIIIDEGHRMKNAECKLALTLGAKYRSRNRILLTGTPLQNNLTELWALLNFLLPTIFSSAESFETWFNAPFQASSLGGGAELNEEEQLLVISRLHQVLRPFMLRRLKTDVETQLPDKVESVMRCDMSVWQKVLCRQMTGKLGILSSGSVRTFNNVVMQLKKVCNHPYIFYNDEELMSVPRDYLVRAAGKFQMLEHAFRKLSATGHRVLMFSQMTRALDYLGYFLAGMGLHYMRLDGTTKADDRQVMLEQFNAPDSKFFCFLLSTRAGGLGLNLQTADTVFIFDSDWNPMMDLQAQDRAHRIGQTREVRVFRLITAGSIEEKILERANQKLHMDAQIIQAGQFNNQSSETDRTEMLKEIMQSHSKEEDDVDDVSSLEELNRMLARSEEEFDKFQEMDQERLEAGESSLLTEESDLPPWVLKPEVKEKKSRSALFEEINFETHGRSRRKRFEVSYDDGLTQKEWTEAVEQDGGIQEASKRKRRKTDKAEAYQSGPSKRRQ